MMGNAEQTKEQFQDSFSKLDFDGDEQVTLEEMINYEMSRIYRQELLMVGICWIGRCLDPDVTQHKNIMEGKYEDKPSFDGTSYYPWFELNHIGQPICINEYATSIAEGQNTHVIHFDDHQSGNEPITEE